MIDVCAVVSSSLLSSIMLSYAASRFSLCRISRMRSFRSGSACPRAPPANPASVRKVVAPPSSPPPPAALADGAKVDDSGPGSTPPSSFTSTGAAEGRPFCRSSSFCSRPMAILRSRFCWRESLTCWSSRRRSSWRASARCFHLRVSLRCFSR